MNGLNRFMNSSVGAKYVMAITGILMIAWLFMHMAGNLQMFLGAKAMNSYAYALKNDVMISKILWPMRLGLLAIVFLHIWSAVRLSSINASARPVRYVANQKHSASSYASRTMIWSGAIVLAFIIYHLLHFTVGAVQSEFHALKTAEGHHDVYRMAVMGFKTTIVTGFYVLAQVLLALHLSHGVTSFFQTMGWNNGKYQALWKKAGPVISGILCLGFLSVPLSVWLGIIK